MAEKHTEHITYIYISKLLNIKEYNTKGNKQLFKTCIPDGWLLNNNNLLIIENKANEKQFEEGADQLLKYCKIVKQNKDNEKYNIFCILSTGTTEEEHKIYYFKYNEEKENFKKQKEERIKEIFANVSKSYNLQSIHDMFIKNFHFDNSEELHDMITVIISSFVNDDLKQFYNMKDEMITQEFITLLIDNARELLGNGYEKYLKIIQETEFRNAFKTCKTIYNAYKQDPHVIANLFQQFKKYNKTSLAKNEVWTEPEICKIMFNELDNLIKNELHKNNNDKLTVCDPCMGGGNLLKDFMTNYENLIIKGCDVNKRLLMNNKLELIIKGFETDNIYANDYFDIDNDKLKCDVLICGPMFSKKFSKKDCLKFVNKSLEHCKYCCYIMPKNKFIIEKKEFEKLLKKHTIIKIINIGKIFKRVAATGDIIIFIAAKKKLEIKTKYIEIPEIANEYNKKIRKDEFEFTYKGINILNDLYNDKLKNTEYEPTIKEPYPILNKFDLLTNIKNNIINNYEKEILKINDMFIAKHRMNDMVKIMVDSIEDVKACKNIIEIYNYKYRDNLNYNESKKFKLMDIFELVKFKPISSISKIESGIYPVFGASMFDEPIMYGDIFNIDTNGNEYLQLNKVGAGAGYCFVRTGKFSLNTNCLLLKLKDEYKNKIDLNKNINLMTIQISNIGFDYIKPLNRERLNEIELYLNFEQETEETEETEDNKPKYKLMDYFELVKFKPIKANYEPENKEKETLIYPLYGASKYSKEIKNIDIYNIDTHGKEYIQLNKDGAGAGYCFVRSGKFSLNSHCLLLKLKEEYENKINLKDNEKLLTLQLTNMGFSFLKSINIERLNEIKICLEFNE